MNFLLSTLDPNAARHAARHGLGLELSEFCTAWYLDARFCEIAPKLQDDLLIAPARVLHAPFNELFPCAIDPEARALAAKRYGQSLAMAQRYGAKTVVIHGGFQPYMYYPQWYTEQSVVFWREFLPKIPQNMRICLENVLEPEPELLCDIVRAVHDARVRLCLDLGHICAYSKISVWKWLEACQGLCVHFHIHNNDGTRDSHGALFDGALPMAELLREIARSFPAATLTLELSDAQPSIDWLLREEFL